MEFSQQPDEQKVFSAIWALESEVNNGGFEQYFGNASGETASFAPVALQRIGANQCAAIVSKALAVVGPGPFPTARDTRDDLMSSLSDDACEELSALDSQFFAYPDDLTELLFEFVRANPQAFGPVAMT